MPGTRSLKDGLAEFRDLVRRDSYNTIENVKKELKEEMKSSFCSIEQAMKKELGEMEERIIQRTEKIVSVIEDVLSMGCFSCLLGGTFDDTFMIPRVTLTQALVYIVELEPPAKKMCTPVIAGPSNSEQPVTPNPPKMKTSTKRKYSWKRDNPDEEELIIAKCTRLNESGLGVQKCPWLRCIIRPPISL